ncbi:hypothetical protein DKY63_14120 [Pseudomonas putida]|uniref:Uncharacterized protein n=1 Tax=Pseudomonas putida TaxID=303 RepID=A0A2Z4RIM5_PSEPU|nr:hypothetical protein DKY63_14120 [Pseudomonas putida]
MSFVRPSSRAGSLLQWIGVHRPNVGASLLAMRPARAAPISDQAPRTRQASAGKVTDTGCPTRNPTS